MKKISFIILLVALGGCSNSDNPYGAMFDNNGCLVCDNYKAGEKNPSAEMLVGFNF